MPTDLMALFRPGPGVNMVEALNNAQQVLEVLVQAQQEEAVQVRGRGSQEGSNSWGPERDSDRYPAVVAVNWFKH
jgi:hypothetical protein